MGDLLDDLVSIGRDKAVELQAAADAKAAVEAKAKLDGEARVLDDLLAATKLEIATKAAAIAKGELAERMAEIVDHKRRVAVEERAIVQDRARRGKRVLTPTELRVRAHRSVNQQDLKTTRKAGK